MKLDSQYDCTVVAREIGFFHSRVQSYSEINAAVTYDYTFVPEKGLELQYLILPFTIHASPGIC